MNTQFCVDGGFFSLVLPHIERSLPAPPDPIAQLPRGWAVRKDGRRDVTHVLMVGDDDDLRCVIRMVLEDAGHTMLEAPDGTRAVDLLRTAARPLVVLLDLALPRAGDGAILRAIQAEPALARHCYVAVTALAPSRFKPQVRTLMAAVCAEVVAKPFDIDDLLAAVQRADQQLAAQSDRLVGQGVQLDRALGAGFPPASTSHG